MRIGTVGGALVVSGSLLLGLSGVIATAGGSVSVAGSSLGGAVVTAALALLAAGAALLGLTGEGGLRSRSVRAGLGLMAVGIASTLATSGVSASSMLVVVFLLGGMVALVGGVVTSLALLREAGRPRHVALTFLAGLVLAGAAALLTNAAVASDATQASLLRAAAQILALGGGGAMVIAVAAIGLLGIRASTDDAPA
jgi:hypothetical protein